MRIQIEGSYILQGSLKILGTDDGLKLLIFDISVGGAISKSRGEFLSGVLAATCEIYKEVSARSETDDEFSTPVYDVI